MKKTAFAIILTLIVLRSVAQETAQSDTLNFLKNAIKLNISSFAIYDQSLILQYERVLKRNQSISVELGYATLPKLDSLVSDEFIFKRENENSGYKAFVDYRFYPKNENKYNAPRGVYFGPYLGYYRFNKKNNFQVIDSTSLQVELNGKINIMQAGVELGYQFIFYKRWSLDFLLIGPALSFYSADLTFSSDISNESEILKDFYQALANKYPGLTTLVQEGEIQTSGRTGFFAAGFRYSIALGFLF